MHSLPGPLLECQLRTSRIRSLPSASRSRPAKPGTRWPPPPRCWLQPSTAHSPCPPSGGYPRRRPCCCSSPSPGRPRSSRRRPAASAPANPRPATAPHPGPATAEPTRHLSHRLRRRRRSTARSLPGPLLECRLRTSRNRSLPSASRSRPAKPGTRWPPPPRCWLQPSTAHSPCPPSGGYPRRRPCCCSSPSPGRPRSSRRRPAASAPANPRPATAPHPGPATAEPTRHLSHRLRRRRRSTARSLPGPLLECRLRTSRNRSHPSGSRIRPTRLRIQ